RGRATCRAVCEPGERPGSTGDLSSKCLYDTITSTSRPMTWTPTPERWRAPVAADAARYSPTEVFAAGLRNHHIANTAYPIAHQRTFKPCRGARGDHLQVTQAGFSGFADMCLYVHVPFCETRCSFCEYTVVGKDQRDQTDVYVDALVGELELYDRVI